VLGALGMSESKKNYFWPLVFGAEIGGWTQKKLLELYAWRFRHGSKDFFAFGLLF
jgi:hypothetical protein